MGHILVITIIIASIFLCSECKVLNSYIQHYEPLTYAVDRVDISHNRVKRSNNPHARMSVRFQALGRKFHLRLKRNRNVFSKDFTLEFHDGSTVKHDPSYVYEGFVKGDGKSHVFGSIISGTFAGVIHTSNGTYYVEKYEQYFTEHPGAFHSIIYRDEDVITDPHRKKREGHVAQCGVADPKIERWMRQVQDSAEENTIEKEKRHTIRHDDSTAFSSYENRYSAFVNRKKRQEDNGARTCTLYIQVDPYLWTYFTNTLGYSDTRATEEITSLMGSHAEAVKFIYKATEFNYQRQSDPLTGFTFVVNRIKIIKYPEACENADEPNEFCPRHVDSSNFLNILSLMNHDEYCLAYAFTYRDFSGGTLGLAWVGSSTGGSGGVCEVNKRYRQGTGVVTRSLNTGIVTLVNYNERVPQKVSVITFAHEIGHNFGSPHDNGIECTPFTSSNNEDGNYIMFPSATRGDRPNNSKFSSCSVGNMTRVLNAVVTENRKVNCFVASDDAFCGNNIVEANETCDCGYRESCTDTCCHAGDRDNTANQCTLVAGKDCSTSQGPCCLADCTFQPNTFMCSEEHECTDAQTCAGNNAQCPEPPHKANGTLCNRKTQICLGGSCEGSICSLVGDDWTQCYLTEEETPDASQLCYLACQNPDGECISSLDPGSSGPFRTLLQNISEDNSISGIRLQPGAPCNNFMGYCDVFQRCRGVNADGPLARLTNLLFSDKAFTTITDWMAANWWAVILIALSLIIFMGVFIHVCSVHTPTSNPHKKPARKINMSRRH